MFKEVGSNFLGVMIVSIVIIILSILLGVRKIVAPRRLLLILIFGLMIIIVHTFITFMLFNSPSEVDVQKSLLSIVALFIIFSSLLFVITSALSIDDICFNKILTNIFYFLIANGVVISLRILFGYQSGKEMLFFTEPSHYALIISIFFCFKLRENTKNIFFVIPLLFISFSIENLTLVIGIFMSLCLIFFNRKILIISPLFILIISLASTSFVNSEKFNYYSQRVDISKDSKNTSTLTLLSGYEQALLAIEDTDGMGYGIQNMGYLNERGEIVKTIYSLRGGNSDSNLYDGGFFLSKLVVEFGVLGLIFFILTLILLIKKFSERDDKFIFFTSTIYISIIYFLMRGSGYFTPSSVILFLACIYLLIASPRNIFIIK
ncbi:hypothetical protein LNQ51_08120 [Yersinia ruckeri]|uniref:hypothetical protein n=1 Tax=Yersinia ruckeri TaxID=29486 RepID=UPI0020C07EAD|nr:hypothetical protein [Yersinia ruckeri]MCK8584845.1 hypothetical protein [Yersinia ruckeri]